MPKVRRHFSILWKLLLSTSISITILLALTGWYVQDQMLRVMSQNLRSEMQVSYRAYESLWKARAEMLRTVSLVLSNMSDVRAAFSTNDQVTIRDTAEEIWKKISQADAIFLVTDPHGKVIASLGGGQELGNQIDAVPLAASRFPAQSAGFVAQNGRLYQMVVTPVYVETVSGPGLINVLVAGYVVDSHVAEDLKARTGSDFAFLSATHPIASTLSQDLNSRLSAAPLPPGELHRVDSGGQEYAAIGSPLYDLRNAAVGSILVVRSFEEVRQRIAALQRNLVVTWLVAILAGLAASYLLARRILDPIKHLDRAAARIALQEYQTRVPKTSDDELGRLSETFNAMCASIQQAREDLIRQERISTIGRLSSSIVHDLRNPLAAIYGGAEMLVDSELNESQVKRLAANIYRSSRAVKDLLQDLVDVSRQKGQPPETCRLKDVIEAAAEVQLANAESHGVKIDVDVPPAVELPLERARVERVFLNLIGNALEAMPGGGQISINAEKNGKHVLVRVEDNGPGIPGDVLQRLFQPFVSGKKNGLGLGLALSRQTILDHGGDLWADKNVSVGARFWVRLPLGSITES